MYQCSASGSVGSVWYVFGPPGSASTSEDPDPHLDQKVTDPQRWPYFNTDKCCDTYVGEAELVAEPGALLLLLFGLQLAERVLVRGVLVHVALVPLLLTQAEVVSCTRTANRI